MMTCACISQAPKLTDRNLRGFTVIELMIVVLIAGVLGAIAVPGFQSAMANQRAKAFAQELYLALNQARSEAIKFNGTCSVEVDFANPADWSAGWSIVSREPVAALPDTCVNPRTIATSGGVERMKASGGADVTFDRRGRPTAAVSFIVCDEDNHAKQRVVATSVSGLATVTKTSTACS